MLHIGLAFSSSCLTTSLATNPDAPVTTAVISPTGDISNEREKDLCTNERCIVAWWNYGDFGPVAQTEARRGVARHKGKW